MKKTILLNLVLLLVTAASVPAATRLVPDEYATIQDAIDACMDGDVVVAAPGIYTGPGNRDIDFKGKAITVQSIDPKDPDVVSSTVINCQGTEAEPHRGFNFHSGEDVNSVVEGFTITNGHADYGGGIYCENSSPTITNCTFRDNTAKFEIGFSTMIQNGNSSSMVSNDSVVHAPPGPGPYYRGRGGGFYCRSSNPTLTNCKFIGNSGYIFGGGMCNYDNSSPILTNCTFSSNSALYGGAMSNYTANPSLFNCIFIGNSAKFDGGGIDNYENSSPILTNCTFSSNRASYGGAMNNYTATSSLFNCIFNGNSAGSKGGGMFNGNQSTFKLKNCTFNGNRAGISGGGIYSQNDPPPPPPPLGPSALTITNGISAENAYTNIYDGSASYNIIIANCILWDNEAPNGPQIYLDSDWHVWIKYNDVQGGWPGEGNIDSNPFFVEPGYWDANGVWIEGDYHLLPYSVCIDAGDPNYAAEPNEMDLDGRPRVMGGRIDMGAYEFTSIQAEVRIIPRTINLASKSKWLTCYIWLPDDYSVADIDTNSIFLNGIIQVESVQVNEKQQVAIAEFSREEIQTILNIGEVKLTIIGWLIDGTIFEGKDAIRVVQKSGGKPDRYVQASDPNPVDGETNVSITADLSWTASPYATSHDVYFGTSSPPPFVCNQIDTAFDPGTMAYETKYYWRIDEVSKWGTTTGELWSFTTIESTPPPPPPPIPPPPPPS